MKPTHLLYAALVVAVGIWLWGQLGSDDEAAIRSQLARLGELVEKSAGETALESADRARQLSELFTRDFLAVLEPTGAQLGDAASLARPFVGLRRGASQVSMGVREVEIEVRESGQVADSRATVTLTATFDGQLRRGAYPLEVRWRRERGEWRMEEVRVGAEIEGLGSLF